MVFNQITFAVSNSLQLAFQGPGKINSELAAALEAGIDTIVLESVNEAHRLNNLAEKLGKMQNVFLRINPLYRTSQSCEISQKNSQCSLDNIFLRNPSQETGYFACSRWMWFTAS
jgi:diaminopimelate decarboxylase